MTIWDICRASAASPAMSADARAEYLDKINEEQTDEWADAMEILWWSMSPEDHAVVQSTLAASTSTETEPEHQ
jgi:hypothetical protein